MTASSSSRRVVITGIGLISPLGNTAEMLWEGLTSGRSGVGTLAALPTTPVSQFGAEARPFGEEINDFGPLDAEKKKAIRKSLKVMCRESQMGVAAAQRALHDAGYGSASQGASFDPERSGVVFGSDYMLSPPEELADSVRACTNAAGRFDFTRWGTAGLAAMQPLWLLKYLPNMPASHITFYNDLRGHSNSLTMREAAGNLAIGEALHVIQRGHIDMMIAGATGTRLHVMKAVHAAQIEELAEPDAQPLATASRPFDIHRRGAVLGEGAGVVILEEASTALARGAKIYGEVVGAGAATVTDRRLVARREQALMLAMRSALRQAGATVADVGHIQAHGLSTRSCDIDEARAIRAVFGDRTPRVPVTAAKSYFGNLGAGSGMVELIAGLLALEHGRLFPVLNLAALDPDCAIHAVRQGEEAAPGDSFLNLSVTPQGQASCTFIRRWRA